jgi:hypothetical protein
MTVSIKQCRQMLRPDAPSDALQQAAWESDEMNSDMHSDMHVSDPYRTFLASLRDQTCDVIAADAGLYEKDRQRHSSSFTTLPGPYFRRRLGFRSQLTVK